MHLPPTYAPETIDTKTGSPPRRPIMTPGGAGFYCPCCRCGLPMEKKQEGAKKAVFVCSQCGSVLVALVLPGVSQGGTMTFKPIDPDEGRRRG